MLPSVCGTYWCSGWDAWRGDFAKVIWHRAWCYGTCFPLYRYINTEVYLAVYVIFPKGGYIRTDHSRSIASNNQRCIQGSPRWLGVQIPWIPARYRRWGTSNWWDWPPVSDSKTVGNPLPSSPWNRIVLAPPYPGLQRFKQGQNFNQWTGDDSKALMKVCRINLYSPGIH